MTPIYRWPWIERVAMTACFALLGVLAWALLSLDPIACMIAAFFGFLFFVAADFIETELNDQLDANPFKDQPPRDADKDRKEQGNG